MRIVFVNPPICDSTGRYRLNQPIGANILNAILEKKGHQVAYIDAEALDMDTDTAVNAVLRTKPDAVGMTLTMRNFPSAVTFVDKIKLKSPQLYVAFGGPHASAIPETCLEKSKADSVTIGEADLNICDIFENQIKGIIQGQMPTDLGILPTPAWHRALPKPNQYLGNIPRFDSPECCYLWTRGCLFTTKCKMCVTPDTEVSFIGETKQIKDVSIGDTVLTLNGYDTIKDIQIIPFKGNLVELQIDSKEFVLRVTPDHEIPIVRHSELNRTSNNTSNINHRNQWIEEVSPHFVPASQISYWDYVAVPFPTKEVDNEYSEDFWELAGYYVSEGCLVAIKNRKNLYTLSFSISSKEDKLRDRIMFLIEKVWNKKPSCSINKVSNTYQINLCGKEWLLIYHTLFGKGAKNKQVPDWFITAPLNKQKAFLRGEYFGDGYNDKKAITMCTISKKLAEQVRIMLLRLGCLPLMHFRSKNKQSSTICGRKVNNNNVYIIKVGGARRTILAEILDWKLRSKVSNFNMGYWKKGYALYPVKHIGSIPYEGNVYDITTNGTFVANKIAISNCSHPAFKGKPVRFVPPQKVVEDTKVLLDTYHAKHIFVYADELIGTNKLMNDWLLETCQEIERKDLKFTWKTQGRPNRFTNKVEIFKAMHSVGCKAIMLGIEALSQKVLTALNKGTTVEDIYVTLRNMKAAGIDCFGFFMVGCLEETEDEFQITLRLAKELKQEGLIRWSQVTVMSAERGSQLWDMANKNGWVIEGFKPQWYHYEAALNLPWATPERINQRRIELATVLNS